MSCIRGVSTETREEGTQLHQPLPWERGAGKRDAMLIAKTCRVSEWVSCHPSAPAEAQALASSSLPKGSCVWAAAFCLASLPLNAPSHGNPRSL